MIDTELIKKAKKSSEALIAADSSWREYVEDIKRNAFHLPFTGDYTLLMKDKRLLIEGFCGRLRIDRLYFAGKTYALKEPVIHEPFRIYGVYDNSARFKCFTAEPLVGFHYLGMSGDDVRPICTGEAVCEEPKSLETLRREAGRIVEAFRLINMESLGEVYLPPVYEKLKALVSNKNEPTRTTVEKLVFEKMIEVVL